jgi:hypothetical protein
MEVRPHLDIEVREHMREMNARLERIGAHVARIDARVGDARAMRLLDLPAELLVSIAS